MGLEVEDPAVHTRGQDDARSANRRAQLDEDRRARVDAEELLQGRGIVALHELADREQKLPRTGRMPST